MVSSRTSNEPAGAGDTPIEAAEVDVPVVVDLRSAKERLIQPLRRGWSRTVG
jgi:hypothetical protein